MIGIPIVAEVVTTNSFMAVMFEGRKIPENWPVLEEREEQARSHRFGFAGFTRRAVPARPALGIPQ